MTQKRLKAANPLPSNANKYIQINKGVEIILTTTNSQYQEEIILKTTNGQYQSVDLATTNIKRNFIQANNNLPENASLYIYQHTFFF